MIHCAYLQITNNLLLFVRRITNNLLLFVCRIIHPHCIALRDSDVSTWSNNLVKISVNDVCAKFGIDIKHDGCNRFFWKIQLDKKVIITDELLRWLGYTSSRYCDCKQKFFHLLKKYLDVSYNEVPDTDDPRKKYFVLDAMDFEGKG